MGFIINYFYSVIYFIIMKSFKNFFFNKNFDTFLKENDFLFYFYNNSFNCKKLKLRNNNYNVFFKKYIFFNKIEFK